MNIIKDTLNKLKRQKAAPAVAQTPVQQSAQKPVKKTTAKKKVSNIKIAPATTAPARELSLEERAEKLARGFGLNVQIMSPTDARQKAEEAENVHVNNYLAHKGTDQAYIRPTLDELYLIRSTDIFPEDSTLKTVSNGARVGNYTDDYFINRVFAQDMQKLGITQKDGSPVTCEKDVENIELSPEMIEYANSLKLGKEYDGYSIEPARKLYIKSANDARKRFSMPFKTTRDTLHFTMNTLVSSHSEGNWEGNPFIFIEPYKPHHGTFRNIGGVDSWKFGNLTLESPTLLVRPETLEQLIELAKKNPKVKNTLKQCRIVIMTPNEKIQDSHYVNAVLHEQGVPAFICKDMYVLGSNNSYRVEATGFQESLAGLATELSNNGTPTLSNALHSNTDEAVIEKKAADCDAYDALLKFSRFIADKIGHRGLAEKTAVFEALDTDEKIEEYFKTELLESARTRYESAYETDDPKADSYYETYDALCRVVNSSKEYRLRESKMKNILFKMITNNLTPIFDQMSNDKISRLFNEFRDEYMKELESKYSKPVKFETIKTQKQKGEE